MTGWKRKESTLIQKLGQDVSRWTHQTGCWKADLKQPFCPHSQTLPVELNPSYHPHLQTMRSFHSQVGGGTFTTSTREASSSSLTLAVYY